MLLTRLQPGAMAGEPHEEFQCSAGIAMATGAEPSFHLLGFLAAVGATSLRAFKSVLQVGADCGGVCP